MNSWVRELLPLEDERERLFDTLRRYKSSMDIKRFFVDLRKVLDEPTKLELYEYLRPLVPPKHQIEYDKLAPSLPGQRLRIVRLRKRPGESLGFSVRGGADRGFPEVMHHRDVKHHPSCELVKRYEHGIGVFVSHVQKKSQAEAQGLKVGDEIVRVNGFTIGEAIHEEVLNLIKGRDEIDLRVTSIGMLPVKQKAEDHISWDYVETANSTKLLQQVLDETEELKHEGKEVKVFVNLTGAPGLGCGIVSGPHYFKGIFIESIKPGSVAEEVGLEVGDQLLEVNDKSLLNVAHKEAVVYLVGTKHINLVVRKGAGLPLLPSKTAKNKDIPAEPFVKEKDLPAKTVVKSEVHRADEPAPDTDLSHSENNRNKEEKTQKERKIQIEKEEELKELKDKEMLEKLLQSQDEERKKRAEAARKEQFKEEQNRQERLKAEAKKLLQDREEKQKEDFSAVERKKKQQTEVLGGKVASYLTKQKPSLLGPAQPKKPVPTKSLANMFTVKEIDGRELKAVELKKDDTVEIHLEGGVGTPLGDKIVIADIYDPMNSESKVEIQKGDQLLMVDKQRMLGITLEKAESIIKDAKANKDSVEYVIAVNPIQNFEDEVDRLSDVLKCAFPFGSSSRGAKRKDALRNFVDVIIQH